MVLVIDETSENVMFSVEDNGIGIEKEFQDMVFERFFSGRFFSIDCNGRWYWAFLCKIFG